MASLLQLARVCAARKIEGLAKLVGIWNDAVRLAEATTPLREALFLAEVAEESGEFRATEECLYYSAETLVRVWPHHFASEEAAAPYAHRPDTLANLVYANRMGNGPPESGDGYRFRGRGWLMSTGRDAYAHLASALNLPLLDHPELLALPENAAKSAAHFWRTHGLNRFADAGDVLGCTRVINGGKNHEKEREDYYTRAVEALCGMPAVVITEPPKGPSRK